MNGRDIFEAEEVLDKGLWDHQILDGCGAGSLFVPIGPWAKGMPSFLIQVHSDLNSLVLWCRYGL
jgi:hypothetical protein